MDDNNEKRDVLEDRCRKLPELRLAVKKAHYTFAAIGRATDRSASQIGSILRGNYPYYGANKLPKYLRVWLEEHHFQVDVLVTW